MRVAIFSDVHGNLTALEAVLSDITKQQPDLTIFAGDLCVYGSQPAACVQRLREENISSIIGETDRWISNQPILSVDTEEEEQERRKDIDDTAGWTWAQLEEMDRAWLRTLPEYRRVSPTLNPRDDLLAMHASPNDINQSILPPEEIQEQLYGEVKQPDGELETILAGLATGILAFGRVHVPSIRNWKALTLANISSVSLPEDKDPRAKYGLFTYKLGDGWSFEHCFVEYDIGAEVDLLNQLQPPGWQELAEQLLTGELIALDQ